MMLLVLPPVLSGCTAIAAAGIGAAAGGTAIYIHDHRHDHQVESTAPVENESE